MIRALIAALLALHARLACALDVRFAPVAEGVYANIGDSGGRTVQSQGLNTNLGLVVTPQGAVLIDSGATWQSARLIDDVVRRVTTQRGALGDQHRRAGPPLARQWLLPFPGHRTDRACHCVARHAGARPRTARRAGGDCWAPRPTTRCSSCGIVAAATRRAT